MHTIALVAQKGGSGKSTLATSLALAARRAGHTVCLLDTDPLGTLAKWQRRRGPVASLVETVLNAREIEQRLKELESRGVTVAIVDTPSGLSAASTLERPRSTPTLSQWRSCRRSSGGNCSAA